MTEENNQTQEGGPLEEDLLGGAQNDIADTDLSTDVLDILPSIAEEQEEE